MPANTYAHEMAFENKIVTWVIYWFEQRAESENFKCIRQFECVLACDMTVLVFVQYAL